MSRVTDTILTFSFGEDELAAIAAVNGTLALVANEQEFVLTSAHEPQAQVSGGAKMLQVNIALGAFNYVSDDVLASAVRSYAWKRPEAVHVFVNREHDECGFTELRCFSPTDPTPEEREAIASCPAFVGGDVEDRAVALVAHLERQGISATAKVRVSGEQYTVAVVLPSGAVLYVAEPSAED